MSVSRLHAVRGLAPAQPIRHCSTCECQLSRYNDEDYCSACLRERRAATPAAPAPPRLPPRVWELPEVRLALKERDFGRLCALLRNLEALRQDDMARLTGLSQAFLSMLESGDRKLTNIDKIVIFLDGLDVPVELTGPMLRGPATGPPLRRAHHISPRLQSV